MHETHYLAIFLTLLFIIIISYCLPVLAGGHFEVGPKTFLPIYFHLSHCIDENYDVVGCVLEVRFLPKLGLLGLVLVYSRVLWGFGCIYGGSCC